MILLGSLAVVALWQKPWTFSAIPVTGFWLAYFSLLGLGIVLATFHQARGQDRLYPWVAFTSQWMALFRPGSWALGLLCGLAAGWLLLVRRGWRLALALMVTALAVTLAAYERASGGLSSDAMGALLQTNPSEAYEFLFQLFSPTSAAMAVLMVGTAVRLFGIREPGGLTLGRPTLAILAGLLLFSGSSGQVDRALAAYQIVKEAREAGPVLGPDLTNHAIRTLPGRHPMDIVLILGESNSRWHWQLYGYPGQTNPELASLRDGLVLFKDMVSPHSHTVPVLNEMFYRPYLGDSTATGERVRGRASLMNLLRSAGVRSEWYTAQAIYGSQAGNLASMVNACDRHEVFQKRAESRFSADRDGLPDIQACTALMDSVRQEPSTQDRLLVYHMQAAHWPYTERLASGPDDPHPFPLGRAYFGLGQDRSSQVRDYDRVMRFNDHQIASVIRASATSTKPVLVIFCPDHGEDPDHGTGHDSALHSARQVEIPFLVYANLALLAQDPLFRGKVETLSRKPLVNSFTYEFILDTLGIADPNLQRAWDPLFDPDLAPPPRVLFENVHPLYYDQTVGNDGKDPTEAARVNLNDLRSNLSWKAPVFAYRVDSLGKALEAKESFDGIEMDVVYDRARQAFSIHHPPLPDTGLTLDVQLAALSDHPDLRVWLDFKNPGSGPDPAVLAELERLDRKWSLKRRAVLELPDDLPEAGFRSYAAAGWAVSLYVPPDFTALCGRDPVRCQRFAEALAGKAKAAGARYLSFNFAYYDEVARYLIPRKGRLGLLSWTWVKATQQGFSARMRRLPRLDGYIVTFPSRFEY